MLKTLLKKNTRVRVDTVTVNWGRVRGRGTLHKKQSGRGLTPVYVDKLEVVLLLKRNEILGPA